MALWTHWTGWAGQSNAWLLNLGTPPVGFAVSRVGIPSAPLGVANGIWNYGWGSADPFGWRDYLAREYIAAGRPAKASIGWLHGETDANFDNTSYATAAEPPGGLQELMANMAVRMGVNAIWVVHKLNISFAGEEPVMCPVIRSAMDTAVAARSAYAVIQNNDDLVPDVPTNHYSSAQGPTIVARHYAAVAALTGDSSWTP